MIKTNLFDDNLYFCLIYNGAITYILEPDKFGTMSQRIPRDPSYWGFWSDFLEDKFGMMFTFLKDGNLTGGALLLKTIYETPGQGKDAIVYFSIGVMNYNTPQEINTWRVNLNEYECDYGGVYTSIEKMPFQGKLRARMSTVCTTNDYSTVDGDNLLTPISTWQVRLHSKTLLESSEAITASPQVSNNYFDGGSITYIFFVQPDQSNLVSSELSAVFTQPMGLINTGILTPPGAPAATIYADGISQYTAQFGGNLTVKWSGSSNIWVWANEQPLGIIGGITYPDKSICWIVTPTLVIQRMVGGVLTIVNTLSGTPYTLDRTAPGYAFPTSIATAGLSYVFPIITDATERGYAIKVPMSWDEVWGNVAIQAADNIYVHLDFEPHGQSNILTPAPFSGMLVMMDNFIDDIKYSQYTVAPPTYCDGYRIFDFLTQTVENITGQTNGVISNYFGPGGPGYNYVLTNGYAIRNFGANIYQPKKDLQSLLNDLQAINCLAVGIKKLNNIEYLCVEYISDTFTKNVIGTYKTFKWRDINKSQYCFNKIELGYNKYEGLNLVQNDEFNTQGEYLTQWQEFTDNTLTKKSGLIAAGEIIESQRRNQFISNPGQTLTFDNDIFIIPTSEPCTWVGWQLNFGKDPFGSPAIQFPQIMFFLAGDSCEVNIAGVGIFNFGINYQEPGFPLYLTTPGFPDEWAIFNEGNWVSGTPYGYNTIIYDTVATKWYLCYLPVTGTTRPGLDAAHWWQWDALLVSTPSVIIVPPSPNIIFAERNQPFEVCANVIDPATIYGGRISLKHILYNWRPIVGVGLHFINTLSNEYRSSQIVTTLVKMNALFTSKFNASEPNKGNAGTNVLVENSREFVKNYLQSGENIFSPVGATCQIKIGYNEAQVIAKGLPGELGDPTKDSGGLNLQDDFGIWWFCQVMNFQYNFKTQIADLEVQKVNKVLPTLAP